MQTVDATLNIGGRLTTTVEKLAITPAETLVLKDIHGDDAVHNFRARSEERRNHQEEFDRLEATYGGAGAMSSPGQDRQPRLHQLFPGAIKRLPETFAEIGIIVDFGPLAREPEPLTEEPRPAPIPPPENAAPVELEGGFDVATLARPVATPLPTPADVLPSAPTRKGGDHTAKRRPGRPRKKAL